MGLLDFIIDGLIRAKRYRQRRERRRRKELGLCYHCGYDVRGATGRCPECGRYPIYRKDDPGEGWPVIEVDGEELVDLNLKDGPVDGGEIRGD